MPTCHGIALITAPGIYASSAHRFELLARSAKAAPPGFSD